MGDEGVMAGANCKRYLQNKLVDRKRRRPTSALLDATEIVDEQVVGDGPNRLRQTTRQSTQRHLISAINSLAKPNKTDVLTRITTSSSKKYLRSTKQDNEQLSVYGDDLKKRYSSPEYDAMSFTDSDKNDINTIKSSMYLENGNNHDFKKNDSDDYTNFGRRQFDEMDDEDIEETLNNEKDPNAVANEKDKSKESRIKFESINENEYQNTSFDCNSGSSIRLPNLSDLNENAHAPSSSYLNKTREECSYGELGNVVFQCKSSLVQDEKKTKDNHDQIKKPDADYKNPTENDIDVPNEQFVFTPTSSQELQVNNSLVHQNANVSPARTHFSANGDDQQAAYENELSHLSNSLCSENSSSSHPSCKLSMENINENFASNESKQPLNEIILTEIEQNQKHIIKSTNETIESSVLNSSKHPQNTTNVRMPKSPSDEQYHVYKAEDENHGCVMKSSPTTLPPINMTSHTKQETSNESDNNSKFQNVCFQETHIKHDAPDDLSSIASAANMNYIREEETGARSNTEDSIGNDCKDSNLRIEHTSLEQSMQSSLKEQQDKDAEKLQENLENQQKQNDLEQENRRFDKYLEKSSPHQHVEFEAQSNDRVTHQQHEKDIIDAADKVYSQIEEQYRQQHETITTTYEQMINNHQQHQQTNPNEHEELHRRHDVVVDSLQQMQNLQHSMQQQQQQHPHFSAEQLYQLQQQQEHHQQIQMQQHQIQKQEEMQQQQHHNLAPNQQREHRQHHSHLMDFLHPQHHHSNVSNTHSPLHQQQQQQQQHQIHEVYHDLMMDEFHEEHNTPYKLGLSPSTVKHENQDDGYETSAGDVLTPNSHASSTNSVTPQHHMQHGAVVANVVKCEEQHQQHSMRLQQSQHNAHVINEQNQSIQQELAPNESTSNMTNREHYHFMDDDINSAANNSLRNILTPPHSHTRSNQEGGGLNGFMVLQSEASASANLSSANDMYTLTNSSVHHHHSQKPPCLDTQNPNTPITNAEHQHYIEASTEIVGQAQDSILNLQTKSIQKRRGRKKKIPEDGLQPMLEGSNANDTNSITGFTKTKERKKHDRFNGMSEEEVVKRILPDHLCDNLDIVIIGINPGLFAAYKGHHYAGPGNHFWKCLYLSGLTQEQMNADEDFKLMKYGIGFTNMVQRATKGSADLTRKEIKEGSRILLEKLQRFRPKIAVFNGKLIFEVFSGKKDFNFGRQPECVEGTDTFIWVMPSSSARCAQLPRAADKVPFYAALKKFRDYLNGLIPHIDQSECVFTEERIKQQCEQENYKNQQNNATGTNDSAYQNTVGLPNANNALQNPVGYTFDSESNPHGAGEGPGPPPPTTADNNVNNSFMMSSLVGTQHEKKKRGRPKKIKGEEIVDPVTGNKIQVNRQLMGANNGEYGNILNLSVVQVSSSEMPKKKRGRPKKVKPHSNMLQHDIAQSTSMLSQKPNIMSIQSLTSEITQGSPHHMQGLQANHQHVALYSTPPPHQRNIYSPMASPTVSPSLNCSYSTNTPPSQPHHDKLGLPRNGGRESSRTTSADLVPPAHHQQHPIPDQNFGESPPPSSPNICTVDFEPPTGSTATSSIVSENVNSDLNAMHHRLHSTHQRSRFNSPISGEATPDHNANEHFQQWLSPQPNHNIHSPAAAPTTMFVNSPQQPSLSYHDQQQQQMQAIQQQQPQHQDLHPQWPLRHQSRYDELTNSPYMLSSQVHQTHSHNQTNHNHQSQHGNSDVARKSLSGLESLVDQIPTISESESIALSSAAAVNAQVAAAAAVESRLQGMQNSSLADSQQVGDDSHFSSITGPQNLLTASNSPTSAPTNNNQIQQSSTTSSLLNSNFSVSNLAASSASSNNNNTTSNSHENYGLTPNARPLTNPNAYHHSNLMAAAVLAAAAANTPTNLSTPAAAGANNHHASMYMDPHAHLTTHVPVNSIYPSAAPATHHHHHSAVSAHHHHHAAAHYGSAQHSAADYATANNPYAASQGNVTTSHTLHMPSPNYPYGYPTASTQSNYSAYPHSHHANHHHGHPHAHHLAMFDRLKPSDITGYSSGF